MDPLAMGISGHRRSTEFSDATHWTSWVSPAVAPRNASTWDSMQTSSPVISNPTASDISARRASSNAGSHAGTSPEYYSARRIAGRKASYWDDYHHHHPQVTAGKAGGSASDVSGRRATGFFRPPWDRFAGRPPADEGSTWPWLSKIKTIILMAPPTQRRLFTERSWIFYSGNIEYIFNNFNDQSLAIDDLQAVMYAFGAKEECIKDVTRKVDPKMQGKFIVESRKKLVLLATYTSFDQWTNPTNNLRHASKCFRKYLLSPLHFAGYLFGNLATSGYLGRGQPSFMLLGMYSILGVLGASNNYVLNTIDVETFISMWRLHDPQEAQHLKYSIRDNHGGRISCMAFYNLLYYRNAFGKQSINVFDTQGPYDPSLFFPLMDKDKDGFLFSDDLKSFASIFDRAPTDETINHTIRKLDFDGDGKVDVEDFRLALMPVLEGMTWEFWLVAILVKLNF